MNELEALIERHGLCPVAVMGHLEGIVSDCCIGPDTVAPCDCEVAVRFLKGLGREEKLLLKYKQRRLTNDEAAEQCRRIERAVLTREENPP